MGIWLAVPLSQLTVAGAALLLRKKEELSRNLQINGEVGKGESI